MTNRTAHPRNGSVIVVVLWTIAIAALITGAVQLTAQRQGILGRETQARIEARWAARAGIESTISVMAYHTQYPDPEDAWVMSREMGYVAEDTTLNASWQIAWNDENGQIWGGPKDEHSKYNINRDDRALMYDLLYAEGLTIDIAAEIEDWLDEDDEVTAFGAERDFYLSQVPPYEPRNELLRSTAELELIAGIWPEMLRGEDWNLNNRLDPNEDDSDTSWPDDEPDARLDQGWYRYFTTYTVADGATASGEPRLYLPIADPNDLAERLSIDYTQAEALKDFGGDESNRLEQLIDVGGTPSSEAGDELSTLTRDQLIAIQNETTMFSPLDRVAGKMNINTVSADLLRDLLPGEEILADEIIYLRDSKPEGITSMVEVAEIREMTPETWSLLSSLMTTTSNVFTITSRGRSFSGDLEVEIIAVVDRSTIPVKIIEYREQ